MSEPPSLYVAEPRSLTDLRAHLVRRDAAPSDLQFLTEENIDEIGRTISLTAVSAA